MPLLFPLPTKKKKTSHVQGENIGNFPDAVLTNSIDLSDDMGKGKAGGASGYRNGNSNRNCLFDQARGQFHQV